jgi:hypothetical protein
MSSFGGQMRRSFALSVALFAAALAGFGALMNALTAFFGALLGLTSVSPHYAVLFLIAFAVLTPTVFLMPRVAQRARQLAQLGASEAQQRDQRAPIVLLRSFRDDEFRVAPTSWYRYVVSGFRRTLTLEEVVVEMAARNGPVIALGAPGERAAPIGAARSYHSDDEWQGAVVEMLGAASRVVMILGPTENIAWEFAKVREMSIVDKLIVVFPPTTEAELEQRWERLSSVFPEHRDALPHVSGRHTLVCTVSPEHLTFYSSDRANEDAFRLALLAADLSQGATAPRSELLR